MLTILIEIVLTILAWKKWKWKSLIPIGSSFIIAFLIGFGIGLSGGSPSDADGIGFLDFIAIIALIIMCLVGPKQPGELPNNK